MGESSAPYQVVARRFRPRTFAEVVGQEAVLKSIRSALESKAVPHAFLFSGSRGTGKTTLARIVARALNCERGVGPNPCGECGQCTTILANSNPDVLEIDAASHNLVDDIRELRERVGFASMGARYKVYILDEVHMLTRNAFNAFLKTLEEPPANVVFIMATTELHKVPETIRSRCQVLLFRRIGESDIERRLGAICDAEGIKLPGDVLAEIALTARGGMRDAETALERILPVARQAGAAFDLDAYRGLVHRVGLAAAFDVVEQLCTGAAAPALHFVERVVDSGVDEREALGELLDVLRAALLLKVDGDKSTLVSLSGELRDRATTIAAGTEVMRLDAMIQAGLLGRERIRRLEDRRLVLEVTLLRMAEVGQLPTLGSIAHALESGGSALAPAPVSGRAIPAKVPQGDDDLMSALIARVKTERPLLEHSIRLCTVAVQAGGAVVLTLRTEQKIHRDRLESKPNQDLLSKLIREILGRDIRLEVRVDGDATPPPKSKPPPSDRVKRIADTFDGKIVDWDDSSPS